MAQPSATEVLASGELDPQTAWTLFDPSPEAQIAWAESYLTVPNEHGRIVDFKCYPQQRKMAMDATGRDWTVKGRQTRASSWFLARNTRRMSNSMSMGIKCVIATQDDQTTATFRERIKHHLKDLATAGLHYDLVLNNKDELVIGGLENHFLFVSGNEDVMGRAYTGHIVHLSEISHWPEENASKLLGDILPAIPGAPHGQFDGESTPNGAEGTFYEWIMSGAPRDPNASHTSHFYPWWMEPRYKAGSDPFTCDLYLPPEDLALRIATFSPSLEEESLMLQHNLRIEHILWRRYREAELKRTAVPFKQEYPEDFDGCFLSKGGNYFASPDGVDHLGWYRKQAVDPIIVREGITWRGGEVSFYGPQLRVWETPQPGHAYCGWVDCAGGGLEDRADYSAFGIMDADTLRNVATLWLKCSPDEFAPMVAAVATWYNNATVGGERDPFGLTCLEKLRELHYDHLWYYIDPADPPGPGDIVQPWSHPNKTREKMLTSFKGSIFTHRFKSNDANLFREMGAFTWQKIRQRTTLKAAARGGMHDDLVTVNAGCVYIAPSVASGTHVENAKLAEQIMVGQHGLIIRSRVDLDVPPWFR